MKLDHYNFKESARILLILSNKKEIEIKNFKPLPSGYSGDHLIVVPLPLDFNLEDYLNDKCGKERILIKVYFGLKLDRTFSLSSVTLTDARVKNQELHLETHSSGLGYSVHDEEICVTL